MTRTDNILTSPYLYLYKGEFNWLTYLAGGGGGVQIFFFSNANRPCRHLSIFQMQEKRLVLLNSRQ